MITLALSFITLFPARAGMNRELGGTTRAQLSVPRTRGDEPDIFGGKDPRTCCSPHARG